ncbi:acyltransferase family protein [Marinitenerispora sediminis]|nr:acyltransferase family protein [Marinitenerispora sediminis]
MRSDYVDWLRSLGILYLFPYHTARVFNEGTPFYVKGEVNAFSSVLVELSYWFMPLLFLLAGAASHHALRRRSAGRYLRERVFRLLVPFLFGALVIVPPQSYYAMRFHRDYQGGYGEFLRSYFTDFSDWSEYAGGISPAHLWFILFLFVISAALVLPMRAAVRTGYAPGWPRHPVLLVLPAAVLAVLSLLPDLAGKNILVFAGYFLLGFLVAADDAVVGAVERHRRWYLAAALLGAAGVLADIRVPGDRPDALSAGLEQLACWVALLAMLGYGKRYLNRRSAAMTYFGPASFPVYVLHQTFLVAVGYYVLLVADSGVVPFLAVMVLSFVLSLASYEAIRRVGAARAVFGLGASRHGVGHGRT